MAAHAIIDEERLRIMLSSGITRSKIAEKFGVTKGAVTLRIKALGIQTTKAITGPDHCVTAGFVNKAPGPKLSKMEKEGHLGIRDLT